jgi:hypothetical protein
MLPGEQHGRHGNSGHSSSSAESHWSPGSGLAMKSTKQLGSGLGELLMPVLYLCWGAGASMGEQVPYFGGHLCFLTRLSTQNKASFSIHLFPFSHGVGCAPAWLLQARDFPGVVR